MNIPEEEEEGSLMDTTITSHLLPSRAGRSARSPDEGGWSSRNPEGPTNKTKTCAVPNGLVS